MTDLNLPPRTGIVLFIVFTLISFSFTKSEKEDYEFINAPCTLRTMVSKGSVTYGLSAGDTVPKKHFLIELNQTIIVNKKYKDFGLSNDKQFTCNSEIYSLGLYEHDINYVLIVENSVNRSPPLFSS